MKRILLRAGKGPFDAVTADQTLSRNTIKTNIGNLVFSHTVHKLLSTPDTEIVPNERESEPKDAARISEEYDAFVVPLANAFRPGFEKHLIRLTELIERLTIPVVVFGVGAQANLEYDLSEMAPLDDLVKRFATAVLDRSPSIGVRGELTELYLKKLGFRDVDVIGCPSMFLYGDQLHVEKRLPELRSDAKLALNVSPHVEVAPYFEDHPLARTMGSIVTYHHQRYPNLVYVPQEISGLELLLWGESLADLGKSDEIPLYASHPLLLEDKVRFFVDPWTWIDFLAGQDFVFGTRIHGNVAGLLAGTPSFVLAHDSRTLELARYFELPYRKLTERSGDLDARELYEEADFTAMHRGLPARFGVLLDFMARHELDCSFGPKGGAEQFDRRLAEVRFPPPVAPLTSENAKDRLRLVKDETVALRRELRRQTGRADRLEAARGKLSGRVDALSEANAGLARRLEQAERDIVALRDTPYRRLRRKLGRRVRTLLRRTR